METATIANQSAREYTSSERWMTIRHLLCWPGRGRCRFSRFARPAVGRGSHRPMEARGSNEAGILGMHGLSLHDPIHRSDYQQPASLSSLSSLQWFHSRRLRPKRRVARQPARATVAVLVRWPSLLGDPPAVIRRCGALPCVFAVLVVGFVFAAAGWLSPVVGHSAHHSTRCEAGSRAQRGERGDSERPAISQTVNNTHALRQGHTTRANERRTREHTTAAVRSAPPDALAVIEQCRLSAAAVGMAAPPCCCSTSFLAVPAASRSAPHDHGPPLESSTATAESVPAHLSLITHSSFAARHRLDSSLIVHLSQRHRPGCSRCPTDSAHRPLAARNAAAAVLSLPSRSSKF